MQARKAASIYCEIRVIQLSKPRPILPAVRAPFCGSSLKENDLPLQIQRFLAELIRRRDHARICLVGSLEGNQVGEFPGDIDGRTFESVRLDLAPATGIGNAVDRLRALAGDVKLLSPTAISEDGLFTSATAS